MNRYLFLLTVFAFLNVVADAQNTNPTPANTYKKLNPNLQYAFIENRPTTAHPQEGDQVILRMQSVFNNRLMYSSAQAFKGKPAVYGVSKPSFKGDLIEAIVQMTPGDSIVCLVDAEAMYNFSKVKLPEFMKPGDKIQYFIKLVSIKTKEQVQKEQQAAIMKQMKEQEAKQKAAAAKQLIADDKALKLYFTKKQINPVKTASGLYYTIQQQGSGELAIPGDSVTMNYTGILLDGTKFDSNTDSAFQHVKPLEFVLGRGGVIKGWDEGITYLKSGAKATFYVPSPLAYGPQARPGSTTNPKGIPANSVLLFDVELVSSKHPQPPPASKTTMDTLGNLITPMIKNN